MSNADGPMSNTVGPDKSAERSLADRMRDLAPQPVRVRWEAMKELAKDPYLATLLVGGFLVVKVIVVSRGDVPTALGVMRTAGITSVVVGGLLTALSVVLAIPFAGGIAWVLALLVASRRDIGWLRQHYADETKEASGHHEGPPAVGSRRRWERATEARTAAWAVIAAGTGCFLLTPWTVLIGGLVVGVSLWALCLRDDGRNAGPAPEVAAQAAKDAAPETEVPRPPVVVVQPFRFMLWSLVVGFSAFALYSIMYAVWVPHEVVTIVNRKEPVVGYVLDDNGTWTSILVSGRRNLEAFKTDQVESRVICSHPGFQGGATSETAMRLLRIRWGSPSADCWKTTASRPGG